MGKKNLVLLILFFAITLLSSYFIFVATNHSFSLKTIDSVKANKLMIVAHPDDETIWGGSHLLKDNYLVVCITCGSNEIRAREFTKVMADAKTEYIMLGYPDLVDGEKSKWENERKDIEKDIKKIINTKDWELIVTHNTMGEYGHIHHILTNQIVTEVYEGLKPNGKLYYFGRYYTKQEIENMKEKPKETDKNTVDKKEDLLSGYKTQDKVLELLEHMFPYEDWYEYNK